MLSPRKREWAATGSAEASLRAAGDGRQDPVAGSRPGESIDELAGSAQPDGFERRLFSPRSARRDCATASPSLGLAGRCGLASNVTPQDAGVTYNHLFQQDGAKDRENGRQRWAAKVQGVRDPPGSWLQRTGSKEAREKRSYSSGTMPTLMSLKSLL